MKAVTWVSFNRSFTDILLEKVIDLRVDLRGSRLPTLKPPRSESIPALQGLFHPVFGLVERFLMASSGRVGGSDRFRDDHGHPVYRRPR